jgi:hypothetical protein
MWREGWLPCPHCCAPFRVLDVWLGRKVACDTCGELLRPGMAERIQRDDGTAVDRISCPWCGGVQDWTALECIGAERVERVWYSCADCHRPFVVEHAVVVKGQDALADASARELAWWRFLRWFRGRHDGDTERTDT